MDLLFSFKNIPVNKAKHVYNFLCDHEFGVSNK